MSTLSLFALVLLQNASFTLVSRARNSGSYAYHAFGAVCSNGMYLLVFKQLSLNINDTTTQATYLVASVCGSLLMHHVAQRFFERKKQG
ncbi:hypothetical protein [Hymenobacter latericus]|uniref:hypothetical protein n=1 Tax=Hymenobacter sp. YIM 151858-1 TaxID=2987688 RepID=UPI002227B5D8|nr:hypothetical protein [Hymenobacter sp. YIM 151858-1]UYZ60090.1 hypothetical protein OIS50_04640 [Hymenobacter sp. YIM 151858-1]